MNEAEAHMRCILLLELFSVFSLKELGYFLGFLILEAAIVTSFQEKRGKRRGERGKETRQWIKEKKEGEEREKETREERTLERRGEGQGSCSSGSLT